MNERVATLRTLIVLGLAVTALQAQKSQVKPSSPVSPARPAGSSPATTPTPSRPATAGRTSPPLGSRGALAYVPRPWAMPAPRSRMIIPPQPLPRWQQMPGQNEWKSRDLLKEVQAMSRRGFIPVVLAGDAEQISGKSWFPAGWIAYGFVVPAKEKLHVRLHHPNEAWFRLAMVDRWGQMRPGMLQNLIPTGNPEVTYINPGEAATAVYVIVDDPGWMSTEGNPFTLKVERSWSTAGTQAPEMPKVLGIWAQAPLVAHETKAPVPAPES